MNQQLKPRTITNDLLEVDSVYCFDFDGIFSEETDDGENVLLVKILEAWVDDEGGENYIGYSITEDDMIIIDSDMMASFRSFKA